MKETAIQTSAILMRHLLASIDLSDVEELDKIRITNDEAMARAGDAELFYKSHFEKVIKLLAWQQLEFTAKEATDQDMLQFARGTFNGIAIVKEWFEDQRKKSLSRFDKPEEG